MNEYIWHFGWIGKNRCKQKFHTGKREYWILDNWNYFKESDPTSEDGILKVKKYNLIDIPKDIINFIDNIEVNDN